MRVRSLFVLVVVGLFVGFFKVNSGLAMILETAESFAVFGSATVTNTGLSVVTGDLGVNPGSAITGFPPGIVVGSTYGPGMVTIQAQDDAVNVYNGLSVMPFDTDLTGQNLGGLTLTSGVYHFNSSADLTGALILDAQGMDTSFWVFQMDTTLTTASLSSVTLINPGNNNGIFWQVGTSATLGTGTMFLGNILADQSVTLTTNADIMGRAFALNGAVTMDTNNISKGYSGGLEFNQQGQLVQTSPGTAVPEPLTMCSLALGLIGLRLKRNKIIS